MKEAAEVPTQSAFMRDKAFIAALASGRLRTYSPETHRVVSLLELEHLARKAKSASVAGRKDYDPDWEDVKLWVSRWLVVPAAEGGET